MAFMDILKKIAAGGERIAAKDVKALKADRRYNERVQLGNCHLVQIRIGELAFSLADISYGGVAVHLSKEVYQKLADTNPHEGEIIAPKGSIRCGFESARFHEGQAGNIAGLVFRHESRDSLVFLREIVEPLLQGTTLAKINAENMESEKIVQGVTYYRGQGPCDLAVGKNGESLNLTFPMIGGDYGEIRLKEGYLSTGITLPVSEPRYSSSKQIAETNKFIVDIFQQGALTLAGAAVHNGRELNIVLDAIQDRFLEWQAKQTA